MSHTVHVHVMDPAVRVSFQQNAGWNGVVIHSDGDRVLSIALAKPTDAPGLFADPRILADQLEVVAAAIRAEYPARDAGDHHAYPMAVAS